MFCVTEETQHPLIHTRVIVVLKMVKFFLSVEPVKGIPVSEINRISSGELEYSVAVSHE